MNQILFSKIKPEIKKENTKPKRGLVVFFRFQLIISILIILSCFAYYMYNLYSTKQKESISRQLLSNFNINLLYSNTSRIHYQHC